MALPKPLAPEAQPESLRELATAIREEHKAAEQAFQIAVAANEKRSAHAIAAGRRLLKAKEQVPHGEWLSWVILNCGQLSIRTAQLYMRLAKRYDRMNTAKAQ